jgi:hydroxyacylglutathione hydrolase
VIVKQIWTANNYRNFNYLIACGETGEALAVDPLDHEKCLDAAKDAGWQSPRSSTRTSTAITPAATTPWFAQPALRSSRIATRAIRSRDAARPRRGDVVKVGKTVELEVLDTPGTRWRTSACARTPTSRRCSAATRCSTPAPGNCHNGGHPSELYKTFSEQLERLPPSTRIYPGHDYIENNLKFTLDREPDNRDAADMLRRVAGHDPATAFVTTLDIERTINTFLRLSSPTVIAKLREAFPDLPDKPDERTVFLKLRELRNKW